MSSAEPRPASPARPPRRWRVAGTLLAFLGLAYAILPVLSSTEPIRQRVESAAAAATGNNIRIEQLRLGYDLGLHLSQVSASEHGAAPFLSVDKAAAYIAPLGLLSGRPFEVWLKAPRVFIDRLPNASQAQGETRLPFWRAQIEDGYFVTDANGEIGPVTVSVDGIRAEHEAHASLEIDPQLPPLDIVASVSTPGGKLALALLQLSWTSVPLAILAQRYPTITSATVDGVVDMSAQASGPLDDLKGTGSLRVQGLRYRSGSVDLGGDVDAPFTLNGNQVTLAEPGLSLAGVTWSIAGLTGSAAVATFAGSITRDAGIVKGNGNLALNKVQGHDLSSERAIEGLAITGTLEGRWSATEPFAVRINLSAATGELLWDRIYADISSHPMTIGCTINPTPDGIQVSDIKARAKGIGSLKGRASLDSGAIVQRAEAEIDVSDIDGLYALAVRDAFKEMYPVLANTRVGGALNLHAEYARVGSDVSVRGDLHVKNGVISVTDPVFEAQGLDLELPLQLGEVKERTRQTGKLRIGAMHFGDAEVGEVAAGLSVRANAVELAAPISVRLLGGTLQIDELAFEEIASAQPRGRFGVRAQGIDLEVLTKAIGLPPLHGTMSGAIPQITATSAEVRSEGEIRIRAFDGDIAVRNLSVEQLFSSVPTFGLDLDFDDISLARLTETLQVGRISGVARGAARNLKIVSGEPLSFDAWMESVERPGVSQRISVSAIRQLSILGGSGSDPFSQGVLGFFDEYRYAKMGFKCRLENDRFLLRGVETIDGKEYLVVGSRLPPRVNVVSHNQVVSFSEMVRRLQRVTTAKAPEEPKGDQQ